MPVLVLQPLAQHGRAPGGAAHQEALAARIRERPCHVADALETEHRVVHVERDHRQPVVGVGRARRGERGHRAGLGNSLFENLPVLLLAVVEQHVDIMRLVLLAFAGVDAHLPDGRFQTEGAALVGHDRHNEFAECRVLHQVAQNADEAHRRRYGAALRACGPLCKRIQRRRLEVELRHLALRHEAAERLAPLQHVGNLRRVLRRTIRQSVLGRLFRHRDIEALHERRQLVVLQLLLLMAGVARLRGAQPIALHRLGQDHGRTALVFSRALVGVVNLHPVMAAAMQMR